MKDVITSAERQSMLQVTRLNERVARAAAKQRSAELLADFEQKLAAEFRYDDDVVWKQLAEDVQRFVKEADAKVAERCGELGIPKPFRPGLSVGWYKRGENASRERRAELRKVAVTRIEALEAQARQAIERRSAEVQTALIAGSLQSEAARAALASLPSPESLMPALDMPEIRQLSGGGTAVEQG